MKRSEAARYARWSAVLAILLAVITAAVYVKHGVAARAQKKGAPPAAPVNVERQSNGLTFSKMEGQRKIFTVEASKSTEFRNQDDSLLEEVKITIFGQQGDRHDIIRTHSCQYGKNHGAIACSGEVQIDLQSAEDAGKTGPGGGKVAPTAHVETRNVTFDQASGTARTSERVTFRFPSGNGEGVGVEYKSQQGTIQLLRQVKMTLVDNGGPKGTAGKEVHLTGDSMDFDRDSRVLQLAGPAHAETETSQLDAGKITLDLDEDYRAQKLLATAGTAGLKPVIVSAGSSGPMRVSGNVLTAWFDPDGWVKKVDAAGNVEGWHKAADEEEQFTAANSSMDLWPEVSQPKTINLVGNAFLKTEGNDGQTRTLRTEKFRVEFTQGTDERPSQPKRAETLTDGTVEWVDVAEGKTSATAKLRADKLSMDFAEGRAKQMNAVGNVQGERAVPGSPVQTTSANRGEAQLLPNGGWSQIKLDENVKFKEGDRSGQADHAVSVQATQTTTLTGHAQVRDESTDTRASSIAFVQSTGEIRADGGVRSISLQGRGPGSGGGPQLASVPANITAEKMQGNSKAGSALYSGHARLWQGDSVLESDAIELLQKTRELNAVGNVRAVFPQEQGAAAVKTAGAKKSDKKANLWHLSSKTLNYQDVEDRAHLEGNVIVQSEEQRTRSALLDIYFTRAPVAAGNEKGAAVSSQKVASLTPGAQQISRAVGTGGVIVEEQGRKATAERGEYTAADGKFVMSGGNPTLYDRTEGTTKGRQLTFFLADDTIIVDSENGSRILTKHRVEK
jgi:LPS export ABC transporter protein LptC